MTSEVLNDLEILRCKAIGHDTQTLHIEEAYSLKEEIQALVQEDLLDQGIPRLRGLYEVSIARLHYRVERRLSCRSLTLASLSLSLDVVHLAEAHDEDVALTGGVVLYTILHALARDLKAWHSTDQREVASIDILWDILIQVVAVPPLATYVIGSQLVEDISIHSEAEVVLPAVIEVRRVRGEESTVALVLRLRIAVAPHPLIGIVVVEAIEELFTHLELRVSVRDSLLCIGLRCSPVGLTEGYACSDATDRRVAQVVARIILVQLLERLHSHLQVRLDEPIGFGYCTTTSWLIELSIVRIFITHDDSRVSGCRRGIVALSEELDELMISIGAEGVGFPYGVADLLILTFLFG